MKGSKGFTLLELITSLGIIGILISSGAPSFIRLLEANRSITARDTLLGAIQFTRQEALSRATTVTLCPKLFSNTCGKNWANGIIIFIDNNSNGKIDKEEMTLHEIAALQEGESLKWASFGSNNYLRYTTMGDTLNQNGSFIYCPSSQDPSMAQAIIINRNGRPRVAQDTNHNGIIEKANGKDVTC